MFSLILHSKIFNMHPDDEDEDDYPQHSSSEEEDDDMEERFPGSTREGRDTGRFLGVDFPYVPGDPFW